MVKDDLSYDENIESISYLLPTMNCIYEELIVFNNFDLHNFPL